MNSPVEPIRGKMARVLSIREIALNKGSVDGVEIGMVFKILSSEGSEITDPDTGEVIGSVDLEKVSVRVTAVQEKVSVASTFRTRRVNVGGSGVALSGLFEPPKWETRVETIKTEEKSATEEMPEEDSFVKTGDPVVQALKAVNLDNSTQEI